MACAVSFSPWAAALGDTRTRPPPRVEPHTVQHRAERVMCHPGDPKYPGGHAGPDQPHAPGLA